MTKASLAALTGDLAPLGAVGEKRLPVGMSEADALRALLLVLGESCPALAHLPDFGMGLAEVRDMLSVYAGQRIEIPSRRTVARAWEDFQLWLAVEKKLAEAAELASAVDATAARYGVGKKRVAQAHRRFAAFSPKKKT